MIDLKSNIYKQMLNHYFTVFKLHRYLHQRYLLKVYNSLSPPYNFESASGAVIATESPIFT